MGAIWLGHSGPLAKIGFLVLTGHGGYYVDSKGVKVAFPHDIYGCEWLTVRLTHQAVLRHPPHNIPHLCLSASPDLLGTSRP